VKFKIDENLPLEFVDVLRPIGYIAMTVKEQDLHGKADSEVINKCSEENFILITSDLDFADIRLYPPENYSGLIVFRINHQDKWHLIQVFKNIVPILKQEKVKGRLWIVEENRIRVRGGDE
jgi:predicted nuclease of predicted toxin-antitoxin system